MDFNLFNLNPYLLFLIGTTMLYYSSEMIINNAIIFSKKYNISKLVVGVLLLALGTSLPELFVSIIAFLKGNAPIIIGNIIGSNIANIGFVLGFTILFKPLVVPNREKTFIFNICSLFIITLIFSILFFNDNLVNKEAFLLLFLFIIYIYTLVKYFSEDIINEEIKETNSKPLLFIITGFIIIYCGSNLFLNGAIGIANKLGIDDLVIGMTLVSIGTSAPELFTSFTALKKNEYKLALGNIIGSNIINIVFVGGVLGALKSIHIPFNDIKYHIYIMILITCIFIFSTYFFSRIKRIVGLVFISIYFIFIYLNFYT